MYVSLEMTYLWQAYFISQDLILYDETTDSPAEAHTSGMCADLGQVTPVSAPVRPHAAVVSCRRCNTSSLTKLGP
jgi:hypothetical protein